MDENIDEIVTEESVATTESGNVKKAKVDEAQALIESSKNLVSKVESEVDECKVGISEAAENFDNAKRTFNNVTFTNCELLLEKAGFERTPLDEDGDFELSFSREESDIFSVKNLTTGKFTGFVLALIAAIATVVALIYLALTKLNVDLTALSVENIQEQINPVLTWIGTFGGATGGNMAMGAVILGFSGLIMAWIVYAIRVKLKSIKNLKVAKKTFEETEEYCMSKEECKQEMKKIDAHLREVTNEITNFEVILNEQASTLKRVIHVEGVANEDMDYHPTSKKRMRDTDKVMKSIEQLLNTAITTDGKLNYNSVQALSSARGVYDDYLSRIYD